MGACSLENCKNYSSSDMHFFVLNNKFHWWIVLKTNTRDTRVDNIQIVLTELKQNFATSKSIVKIRNQNVQEIILKIDLICGRLESSV